MSFELYVFCMLLQDLFEHLCGYEKVMTYQCPFSLEELTRQNTDFVKNIKACVTQQRNIKRNVGYEFSS